MRNASDEMPVLPADIGVRLQSARKESGKTQSDAADFLGVARTTVVAMEKGERRVQPAELLKLVGFYGQRLSDLLKSTAPGAPLAMQLRAVLATNEEVVREVDAYAWALQHLCEDYVELERLCGVTQVRTYPPARSLTGVSPEHAGEDMASAERNRLGLGDGPIPSLRDTLEQDVGLRIFYLPMASSIAAMFAFDEQLGGCVAVNQNHPEERRRLSLAHEYAHFLTTRLQPSVDYTTRYQRLPEAERFATAFAPAFLMPASGISRRFNDAKRAGEGKFRITDLLTLAHYFAVSVESLTRRLEQLRLVPRGTWADIKEAGFRTREAQALLQLVGGASSSDLLPTRYILLALQGYREEAISQTQLARFLRVDLLEARRVMDIVVSQLQSETVPRIGQGVIDRPGFVKALSE